MEVDVHTIVILLVATQFVISAAATLGSRFKIPAPLILVLAGISVSLVPGAPEMVLDPTIVTLGLLPPLLYASAAAIPAMNFRREFRAINGLSVVLVILSSLALGALFAWLIPDLGFVWGAALGAVLSPTDAAATSLFKGQGVPSRVTVILEGESLLNDATALIALRTAVVATTLGFSVWPTIGNFVLSVGVAVFFGVLAAKLNLAIRSRVHDEAVNTILSFTTPFAAALPAEMLHGSGLVAAVVAGIVIGMRARRVLPPGHRVSDMQNWATLQLSLEGVVFLTMGLQLSTILRKLSVESVGVTQGIVMAGLALLALLAVRCLYVAPLLWSLRRDTQRKQARQPEFVAIQRELEAGRIPEPIARRARRQNPGPEETLVDRLVSRGRRHLADLDYLTSQPLGLAEAAVVIWAGMRGAVTVAAVQLLPAGAPHRPLLVFIAFAVATMSLLVQGGTIGIVAKWLFPSSINEVEEDASRAERARIRALLDATRVPHSEDMSGKEHSLALCRARRIALLDAADEGIFSADALALALRDLDIDELVLELRSGEA